MTGSRLAWLGLIAATAALAACGEPAPPAEPVAAPTELAALDTPPPVYPLRLACDGVGGTTTLSVTVGSEGKPTHVARVAGSGSETLDQAAMEAVKGWQFKAATRNGQAVPQTIQVPVTFTPPQPRPDECFALDAGRSSS
ncbi:energy transducer TonB [Pseudoxanthomonas dokdonensis]|uniref:Energy transducer TonB n=1 Tax=Pseudoxanthomonas dokdonensis TaxID=344882 RepID=A0A0R0CMF5_9GAMM|nr:energy transducer TonB [Pseudoxanthomonas dokdonensis]KRG71103.1 energy transducer TonB [Pseudoxanthomonas dokdonensis]